MALRILKNSINCCTMEKRNIGRLMKNHRQTLLILTLILWTAALSACTYGRIDLGNGKYSQAAAIKGQGGTYKVGNPYKIMGKWYYPAEDYSYSEVGMASWYGEDFHARKTANGENYDMNTLTAAHRTLPLPSIVRVTNLENGRSLVLRINDRGPYAKNRIIDVSKRSAQLLGFQTQGVAKVRVEILEKESKELKAALLGEKYTPSATISRSSSSASSSNEPLRATGYQGDGTAYPKGSYFVQAGAYSKQDSAQNLSNQLSRFGRTNVYFVTVDGQKFYRVRIGPYSYKKEAEVTLAKVKNFGIYNAKVVQD